MSYVPPASTGALCAAAPKSFAVPDREPRELSSTLFESACRKSRRSIGMRESRTGRAAVFRCQKAKSCAIVSHDENVQAQSLGEQRALAAFMEMLLRVLLDFATVSR